MKKTEVSELIGLIKGINSEFSKEQTPKINIKQCKELYNEFSILNENIYNGDNHAFNTNDRLEALIEILSEMGNLNFEKIADVGEEFDHLDYVGFSLNHTNQRLKEQWNVSNRFEAVLGSFSDSLIVTDEKGDILYLNKSFQKHLSVPLSRYLNKHISQLFVLLMVDYGIDFIHGCAQHGIVKEYCKNPTADIVLRVSLRPYASKGGNGYCYKIERLNADLYQSELSSKLIDTIYVDKPLTPNQQIEELKLIAEQYAAKDSLNFREVMILNKVNILLGS
ncbi:MAG: transcriptional regulator with PAS, ATPase and Fis domain [Crocinitomix sp.]|jgi:transcriptional regulator with PAS, ATPase and Fis domain